MKRVFTGRGTDVLKILLTAAAATLLILATATHAQMPAPDPDALWNYITRENPYPRWQSWPDHQGMRPGKAPHGSLHKVFVNEQALKSVRWPLQSGAIEVKENYSPEKELLGLTVMYKVRGYNPDGGDWFWANYSPSGKVQKYGKPAGCIGCHGIKSYNDFVMVHEFK